MNNELYVVGYSLLADSYRNFCNDICESDVHCVWKKVPLYVHP